MGATQVDGGTLLVNGSLLSSSGVSVNNGAVLGGSGVLPNTIIKAGGALSPGRGPARPHR